MVKESALCRLTNLPTTSKSPKFSAINIVTYYLLGAVAEKPFALPRRLFDRLSAWPVFLIAEHSIFLPLPLLLCLGAVSHEKTTITMICVVEIRTGYFEYYGNDGVGGPPL